MPMRSRRLLLPTVATVVALTAGLMLARGDAALVKRPVVVEPPAGRELCGALSDYGGLRVLELWGSPQQAGFAQGYLLAGDIVRLFDEYLLDSRIVPVPQIYEQKVLPATRRMFEWPPAAHAELAAMVDGIRARLPANERVSWQLGRELTLDDLQAANAFADLWGLMCSTFTVWGERTADGQPLTGRNLDFPFTDAMAEAQLVVIRQPHGGQPGFLSVSWPGMIGVYTGMNASGVTILMHDAGGLPPEQKDGFTPRSWILREALEAARPETYLMDVQKVLESRRVAVGNNIHVSGPLNAAGAEASSPAAPGPAAVFEYDGNGESSGVTRRDAAASGTAPVHALFNTNHMRARRPAQDCPRYAGFERLIGANHDPVDVERVFQVLTEVRQANTLHSVCLAPAARTAWVRIPALHAAPVRFDLDAWLTGTLAAPAAGAPAP